MKVSVFSFAIFLGLLTAVTVNAQDDAQVKKYADRLFLAIKSKDENNYRKLLLDFAAAKVDHKRVLSDKLISKRYKQEYSINPPDSAFLVTQNEESVKLFKNLVLSLEHLKADFKNFQILSFGYRIFRNIEIPSGAFEVDNFSILIFDGRQYFKLASCCHNPAYVNFKIYGGCFDGIRVVDKFQETLNQYEVQSHKLDNRLPHLETVYEEKN